MVSENCIRIIINVPFACDITYYESCRVKNVLHGFLNLKDLVCHYRKQHNNIEIELKCSSCSKTFAGMKNWNGHRPKCKGPLIIIDRLFKCTECEQSFDSRIGLSQHERHEHPKIRNLRRQVEAEKPHGIPGRREHVWNQEETNLLILLDKKFREARFPNKEIKAYFPNKTLKQISDKRRCLNNKIAPDLDKIDPPCKDEQGSNDTQVEQNVSLIEVNSQLNMDESWKNIMYNYIGLIKMPSSSKLVNIETSLKNVWINNRENPDILFPLLDKIIDKEIVPKLLNITAKDKKNNNNEDKKNCNKNNDNSKSNYKSNNSKKDKNMNNKYNNNNIDKNKNKCINKSSKKNKNHNQRKKFGYARCQELFNKCPKKLAEYTIKGDFSFMNIRQDPPQDEKIKKLYSDLWGQEGPQKCNLFKTEEFSSPLKLSETIQPITMEEIKNRIVKTKNKSAAGIDGIKKCHLMHAGTVEHLTSLFNILLVEGHFPTSWKANRTTLIPKPDKDLNEINNWRLITVGSLLSRIFSAVLDSKLRQCCKLINKKASLMKMAVDLILFY